MMRRVIRYALVMSVLAAAYYAWVVWYLS